ncbi:MAG: BON domain-containing protein [Gammaproteobacteria bacterium]
MNKYSIGVVAVLAAAGLGLAGCHKSGGPPPANQKPSPSQQMNHGAQQTGAGINGAGRKAGQYGSDTAITTKVKSKLAANQGLSSFNIHVKTNGGVVTLTGTVNAASQRNLADQIAKNTGGVKSVVNNIVVSKNAG